jgi:hypothetical protein
MVITVHVVGELALLAVPEPAFDQRITQVGVGAVQSPQPSDGRFGVVLIFAE